MTCSTCPITVKKAISVEGVSKIDVTFETREAVVTPSDDAKTSAEADHCRNWRRGPSVQRQAVSH